MNDECAQCAAKPGAPTLCDDCLARRRQSRGVSDNEHRDRMRQQAEIDIIARHLERAKALIDEALDESSHFAIPAFNLAVAMTPEGQDRLMGVRAALIAARLAAKYLDVQRAHESALAAETH